jgi:hypothetical protein
MQQSSRRARPQKLNKRAFLDLPEWLRARLHWADQYRQIVEERNRLRKENEALKLKARTAGAQ